jgi:hypothetical protein
MSSSAHQSVGRTATGVKATRCLPAIGGKLVRHLCLASYHSLFCDVKHRQVLSLDHGLFQGYILGSMIRLNIPNSRSPKDRMINAVRIDLISKRELIAISTRTVAKNTVIIM